MTGALRRPAGPAPLPWLAITSCALAIAGVVIFVAGSKFKFEGSYGEDAGTQNVGVNFSFGSEMGTAGEVLIVSCFVVGAALGGLSLHRERTWRAAAGAGLALNAVAAALFVVFLVAAYVQGG